MKHTCSICGETYEFEYQRGGQLPSHFPFCSSRCKTIDLGKWLSGDYRISTRIPDLQMMTDEEKETLTQFLLDAGEVDEIIDDEDE